MTIFWPSTHPSSRSPCRNASSRAGLSEGDDTPSQPIRGTFPACCASAGSGAARRLAARTATSATPLIIMPPPLCAGSTPRRSSASSVHLSVGAVHLDELAGRGLEVLAGGGQVRVDAEDPPEERGGLAVLAERHVTE